MKLNKMVDILATRASLDAMGGIPGPPCGQLLRSLLSTQNTVIQVHSAENLGPAAVKFAQEPNQSLQCDPDRCWSYNIYWLHVA